MRCTTEQLLDRHIFDQEYVDRLVASDPETQAHFSRYFGDLLTIKLRSRLRSSQAVEDLRQETLLRVFQYLRREGVRHPERLGAFVNSVCNNVLLEFFRAGKRDNPLPETAGEYASDEPGPEAVFVSEERKHQVRKALSELPQKDQELLRLVFFEDQDKDDVCRRFGVDRDYLRVLLHRGIGRLRRGFTKTQSTGMRMFGLLMLAV